MPLAGGLCLPVPDAARPRRAERALVRQLAAATAATDGPIARFDRALSTRLSRHLVRTPLRPNHITVIGTADRLPRRVVAGAAAPTCPACSARCCSGCAVIIDGCDGEVARLKFQESFFGYVFDVTTDNLVHVAIFIGLGVGLYRAAPDGQSASGSSRSWSAASPAPPRRPC